MAADKDSISELKDYFPDLDNYEVLEMKREDPEGLDEIRELLDDEIR